MADKWGEATGAQTKNRPAEAERPCDWRGMTPQVIRLQDTGVKG